MKKSNIVLPATRAARLRQPSRFAVHQTLLLKLFKQFPNTSGNNIAFGDAFEANPTLRSVLNAETKEDVGALRQWTAKLLKRIGASTQTLALPPAPTTAPARVAEASGALPGNGEAAEAPARRKYKRRQQPQTEIMVHNFCPVCGTAQKPISHATAMALAMQAQAAQAYTHAR